MVLKNITFTDINFDSEINAVKVSVLKLKRKLKVGKV